MNHRKVYYSPNTFQSFGDTEIAAVESFLRDNPLSATQPVELFESRIASLFSMSHGIFVNSGSSANLLACLALSLGPSDEVITTACTFPTTVSPLIFLGCRLVFCDIATNRFVPSVAQVVSCVTPRTTAVVIPDLIGDKFDFVGLRAALSAMGRCDVRVIEDACDTVTQSVADFATISFYASHVISSGGCGGMVLTSDKRLADRCYELRRRGAWDLSAPSYCAVFGLANSEKFEQVAERRRRNFLRYCRRLKDSTFYELPKANDGLWLAMPLVCKSNRFRVIEELETRQVQTRLVLAGNILRQPCYAALFPDVDPESFPETEKVFERGMLVGLHQGLSDEDIDWVCDQLIEIAEQFAQ